MGVRQTLGYLSGYIEMFHNVAPGDGGVSGLRGLDHQEAIVRQLGEDKHSHHSEDDPQGLVFFKAPGLQQGANDDGVAENHDQQGKAEAHTDLQGQHKDLGPVEDVVPVDQDTEGLALLVGLHLAKDELRQGQETRDDPNTQAGQLAVEQPLILQILGLSDLYDGDVAVHANAGEQQHATEEVDLVDRPYHLAETHTELPALFGISSPEGERAQEEEVCHSQVEQVDVGHGFQTVADSGVDPNHQEVTQGTQGEDEPEERRLILPTELPDPALVTQAFVSRTEVIVICVTRARVLQSKRRVILRCAI